jgi:hypothetical protein
MNAISALGTSIQVDRSQSLTRFQFYLGLADALNCKQHPYSAHLKELADPFSHDVLNIAALAGRLLWYEGVTPEIWRSHDLIAVSVDAEAYYVMLQSACDIMADVVATLGAKKGQAPWESFHKLNEWALRNPGRLDPAYHLVAVSLPWFGKINSERTGIVHRGKKIFVYTDRVTFNWGRFIPGFRELTRSMLEFSEQLGSIVAGEEDRKKNPQKTVIDGVYVPALRHLLNEYAVPEESKNLKFTAKCLLACGGYVEAAYIGYPSGFWWNVVVSTSSGMIGELAAANIPVNARGSVHDCRFVISDGKRRYGLIACDRGKTEPAWLAGAAESAKQLESEYSTHRTAFIVREMEGAFPQFLPGTSVPLIVGADVPGVTSGFVAAMMA